MKKIFITALVMSLLSVGFAQEAKVVDNAPKLTVEQKLKITQLMLAFESVNSQIAPFQQKQNDLRGQYAAFVKEACKSTDGQAYTVDTGDPAKDIEPSCKLIPKEAKTDKVAPHQPAGSPVRPVEPTATPAPAPEPKK